MVITDLTKIFAIILYNYQTDQIWTDCLFNAGNTLKTCIFNSLRYKPFILVSLFLGKKEV